MSAPSPQDRAAQLASLIAASEGSASQTKYDLVIFGVLVIGLIVGGYFIYKKLSYRRVRVSKAMRFLQVVRSSVFLDTFFLVDLAKVETVVLGKCGIVPGIARLDILLGRDQEGGGGCLR